MKRLVLFSVVFGIIISFQLALAQRCDDCAGPMHRMEKMLDLSEEQKVKIEDLRLNFQKEKLPLRSKIHELRTNLKLELTKDSFDESKVNQKLEQIEGLRTEMHKKRINHLRDIRSVLNDEQKQKFDMHILSGPKHGKDRFKHHRIPHHEMHYRDQYRK